MQTELKGVDLACDSDKWSEKGMQAGKKTDHGLVFIPHLIVPAQTATKILGQKVDLGFLPLVPVATAHTSTDSPTFNVVSAILSPR